MLHANNNRTKLNQKAEGFPFFLNPYAYRSYALRQSPTIGIGNQLKQESLCLGTRAGFTDFNSMPFFPIFMIKYI